MCLSLHRPLIGSGRLLRLVWTQLYHCVTIHLPHKTMVHSVFMATIKPQGNCKINLCSPLQVLYSSAIYIETAAVWKHSMKERFFWQKYCLTRDCYDLLIRLPWTLHKHQSPTFTASSFGICMVLFTSSTLSITVVTIALHFRY